MHSYPPDKPSKEPPHASQTIRNRTHLRRLMPNRTVVALLTVENVHYRLPLNCANAEALFDQAETNGHFLIAEPDPDDPYLWLRITPSERL